MATWNDIIMIGRALPAVEEDDNRLLVDGTPFAEVIDDNRVLLSCSHDEKLAHLESGLEFFSTSEGTDDLNAIIVDLRTIDVTTLEECVVEAWLYEAPEEIREGFEE